MKRWEIYLDIIMELLVILAGALLLIFVLPKAIVFLWPFVAGWIVSMMAHPVIEYLEEKGYPVDYDTAQLSQES